MVGYPQISHVLKSIEAHNLKVLELFISIYKGRYCVVVLNINILALRRWDPDRNTRNEAYGRFRNLYIVLGMRDSRHDLDAKWLFWSSGHGIYIHTDDIKKSPCSMFQVSTANVRKVKGTVKYRNEPEKKKPKMQSRQSKGTGTTRIIIHQRM